MKKLLAFLALLAAALVGFGAAALFLFPAPPPTPQGAQTKQLWTCSMHPQVIQDKPGNCPICGMKLVPLRQEPTAPASQAKDRKVKYYWDPMMKPAYISDKPGKSPMGMDLIPVYEDEVRAGPTVTIDPLVTQNIGVRVAMVEVGPLSLTVRTVGFLRRAEPRQYDITLKVEGWIDKLFADTEGMFIRKGAPLFDLYSPELLVAQEELLTAKRALDRLPKEADSRLRADSEQLVESARRKLILWDVPAETIDAVNRDGVARPRITFVGPSDGFVVDKMVVQGSAVEARMKLLRIVDQSVLWLDAQVYEAQLPQISLGQKAKAAVSGLPDRVFEGEVVFISPSIDPMTRTAVARLSFANPDLVLKPGMYATIELRVEIAGRTLIVPREAVIETGIRQIAFVAREGGHFDPRLVRMGAETGDGRVQILAGLAPGEKVVTSGQFLLDAESRMREAIQKMTGEKLLQPPAPGKPEEAPKPQLPHIQSRAPVDEVVLAYLDMVRTLAEDRTVAESAIDRLVAAARKLVESGDHVKAAADRVADSALAVRSPSIESQRKAFKALSEEVIALVEHVPPSFALGGRLYVFHCGMVHAEWLQAANETANPFGGKAMRECGEITRTIETGKR